MQKKKREREIFFLMFCIIFDALFFSDGLFFFLSDVLFSRSLKLDVTANIDIMLMMMTANIY